MAEANVGLGAVLRAEALHEAERAARQLARPGEERHEGIHQARKSIRRVRAILALGGEAFTAAPAVQRLDAALRSLCRGLSSLRDADALRDALLHLSRDAVMGPIECERLCAFVAVLRARRLASALARDPDFARRRARLQEAQTRLGLLPWDRVDEKDVRAAHDYSKKRLRRALKQARGKADVEAWHTLRRRLRRLRQQENALARVVPDAGLSTPGVADLADRMGKAQDHALLLAHCRRSGVFPARDRATIRRLVEPLYVGALEHAAGALEATSA
ncbi:MAG: CHAD domain-containing protein [Silanimonas sp.]